MRYEVHCQGEEQGNEQITAYSLRMFHSLGLELLIYEYPRATIFIVSLGRGIGVVISDP